MGQTEGNKATAAVSIDTLLFVDDEKNILSSLERTFRVLPYRVLTATSGKAGLEIMEKEPVDLVISDMRMPEMSGAEFLARVAERWPDTMRFLLTGYADLESTVSAVNEGHIYKYLSKPWQDNDLKLSVKRALEKKHLEEERRQLLQTVKEQNAELKDLNSNLEQKVEERVHEIERMRGMLESAYRELKKNFVDSVGVFSSIIEAREGSVAGHSRRVANAAHRVAVQMGMNDSEAQHVLFAALLHDIGKVALSDDLLRRPFAALTHEERGEVVKHPVVGEALLMSLASLHTAAKMIRSHHERYDGSGYPDGLKGEDIPLGARILAVANDYDGLRNGRLLLERLSEQETRQYLIRHRGTLYDPHVVDTFLSTLEHGKTEGQDDEMMMMDPGQLRPGMRLARELVTKSGMVLLPEGHVLDQSLILKIQALARNTGAQIRICVQRQ